MSWKEKVEAERQRQAPARAEWENAENAKRQRQAQTRAEWENAENALRESFLARFMQLDALRHLGKVNQDIWQGLGTISGGKEVVVGKNSPRSVRASLTAVTHKRVYEETIEVYEERFSLWKGVGASTYQNQGGGPDHVIYHNDLFRPGFRNVKVGNRVSGYTLSGNTEHVLYVEISTLKRDSVEHDRDWSYRGTKFPLEKYEALSIRDSHGLDVTTLGAGGAKSDNSYVIRNKDYTPTSVSTTEYGLYYQFYGNATELRLNYQPGSFDPELAKRVLELGILASCVERTPNPLITEMAKERAEIAKITSRIGQME